MAVALAAVGYSVALTEEPDADPVEDRGAVSGEAEPLSIDPKRIDRDVEAIELEYAPADPSHFDLIMSQTTRRWDQAGEERQLETELDLRVEEGVEEQPGGDEREAHLAIDRRYERVAAEITGADGESSGDDIAAHVERLLGDAETRTLIGLRGEPIDFQWREVANPHARRTLSLVRDAHELLTPRYMTGAVNPGDTWSYEEPIAVEEPDLGLTAEGSVEVQSHFVGLLDDQKSRRAVMRQRFNMAVDGEALDEDDEAHEFRSEGAGQADILVDLDQGRPVSADLTFERTLTAEQDDDPQTQSSEISVSLRPAE